MQSEFDDPWDIKSILSDLAPASLSYTAQLFISWSVIVGLANPYMLGIIFIASLPYISIADIHIESTVSCNSIVIGQITNSTDTKYYSFINNNSQVDQVDIDLCSSINDTNFDATTNIYDEKMTATGYNDTGDGCNNHGSSQILFQPSSKIQRYIFEIAGNHSKYQIKILCISTVKTTTYYTTSEPTESPISRPSFFLDSICGSTFAGATTSGLDSDYIYFTLSRSYTSITFDTCGSGYDTYLYFQTLTRANIAKCDDCGDCQHRAILTVDKERTK